MLTSIVRFPLDNLPGVIILGVLCFLIIVYFGRYVISGRVLDIPRGFLFLVKGREMIRKATIHHGEKPFSLPTTNARIHYVSSKEHYAELSKAHPTHLSLHSAIKQILWPNLIFGGFQVPDSRDVEGMVIVRGIRSANVRLPYYASKLSDIVHREVESNFKRRPSQDGYTEVPLFDLVQLMVIKVITLFVIGEDAANNPEFIEQTIRYRNRAMLTSELCRTAPVWSHGIISYLVQGNEKSREFCFEVMSTLIQKYMDESKKGVDEAILNKRNASVLEFITRTSPPEWTRGRLVREATMAWMSSMLLSTHIATDLLQDIFIHNEYLPALREEIEEHFDSYENFDVDKLAFLESFVTESARTHSYESTSVHRAALQDYTFADGYTVPKGDWVEYNLQAAFNNPASYPKPELFDPYRHLKTGRKMRDVSVEWPMWGTPHLACPGRFLFDRFLKTLAVIVLREYDCKLSQTTKLNFSWRETEVPNPRVKLLMKKLEKQ